ncbi:GIY-YIG nuclease family protein [Sorangium sp. So ce1097]|uniref:GIY-YIG nuclease family protein n=1 Tax=Sorangium sp. So ce1097 TaxID=3133330 RepID=UPI003F60DFFF
MRPRGSGSRRARQPWRPEATGRLTPTLQAQAPARLAQHAAGRGARCTRGRGPLALVHVEAAADKGEALRREAAIRRWGARARRRSRRGRRG